MKKAYTITPEEYLEKKREIDGIGYRHGRFDRKTGKYKLAESTSDRVRKRFDKLTKEVKETPVPNNRLFFKNPDIYNLWLNRDTDEPITARELYNIVEAIGKAIGEAESSARTAASFANWDGRP